MRYEDISNSQFVLVKTQIIQLHSWKKHTNSLLFYIRLNCRQDALVLPEYFKCIYSKTRTLSYITRVYTSKSVNWDWCLPNIRFINLGQVSIFSFILKWSNLVSCKEFVASYV